MPTLEQFQKDVERFLSEALGAFERSTSPEELEAARIQFIGDRSGQLRSIQQALGALPKEEKPAAGRAFNEIKTQVTAAHETRARSLTSKRVQGSESLDLTMPG